MELTEATPLMNGLVARPLTTGLVRLELDMEADPVGLNKQVLDELARQMGGRQSWRWQKEMLRNPYAQSGESVFDPQWLKSQEGNVRDPIRRMDVDADYNLVERSNGRVRIWMNPDQRPDGLMDTVESADLTFGIGMDVGAGTGASDSTIVVNCVQGREQAAEFNSNRVLPSELGRIAVAIARYFNDALICCVQKMHGVTTIRAMIETGYSMLWRNTDPGKYTETQTGGRIGWVHGENSEKLMIDRVADILSSNNAIIRSRDLLDQLRMYIYDDMGRPTLSKQKDLNPTARQQNGDLVIGEALSMRACMDMPQYRNVNRVKIPPKTPEWYRQMHLAQQQENSEDSRWN